MENSNGDSASNDGAANAAPRRPIKLRNIALGMAMGVVVAIFGVVLLIALTHRESLPAITLDDVDTAAERWTEHGPTDYDMDLEQSGVNPGQIHVEVRHRQVTAMTFNGHVTKTHLWDDWSVPGLLSIIRRDVEVCMPDLDAKAKRDAVAEAADAPPPIVPRGVFDAHDGHPIQYHRITPNGAEVNWRVLKFEAR